MGSALRSRISAKARADGDPGMGNPHPCDLAGNGGAFCADRFQSRRPGDPDALASVTPPGGC